MHQDKSDAADPSQPSEASPGDSPSAVPHSAKLRTKLEKLARWRIDPSLIDFPENSREFRGVYATVSQAFLTSPSKDSEGGANESEDTTDESLGSNAGNLPSHDDNQEHQDAQKVKGRGMGGRETDDNAADVIQQLQEADKTPSNAEEQRPHRQTPLLKVGNVLLSSERVEGEDPEWDDRDPEPQTDTQEPQNDDQGKAEGTESCIADDRSTKEEGRKESENANEEQSYNHPTSKSKLVAVKKLKIESDTDLERVLGLALRESEFLVELSHPNIVRLEGFVEDIAERKLWLIFPWEEHGNLRDFLASGEWEIPERISLINDVTLGLEYLHSQEPPIYHGDLKSLNILVNSGYHALITDFGSARHLKNDHNDLRPKQTRDEPGPAGDLSTAEGSITLEALFSATTSTLTLTGSGYTLRWAAPELLQDDKPCLRSDIWALGWIAYEVMKNTIPFHDVKKDAMVVNSVVQGHLPSITEDARMSLIRALCSLMVQCWKIDHEKRPTAEQCRKLISWMPMIVPAPTRSIDEDDSSTRYAQLLSQLGNMYKRQGDYLNAFNCFTRASKIYTLHNDRNGKSSNLRSLADLHLFRGEHTEAASLYTEALQVHTEAGVDQMERAHAILGLAEVHRTQEHYGEARRLYSECLQIYTNINSRRYRTLALFGLADVHLSRSQYSEAETQYLEALEIFTDLGDREGRGSVLWSLGEVHRRRNEYSEAANCYSEALEIDTDLGDKPARGTALWGLGQVQLRQGKYEEALKLFSEAVEIFTKVGDKYWRAHALVSLAKSHTMQGHRTEAISFYREASKALEEIGDLSRAASVLKDAEDISNAAEEATDNSAAR